tara:strand:- start:42 stop:527 length:486 start_codon:yes stop_codon:yes gene_type:complete
MNFFIIANNPKYTNNNNVENKYQKGDKVVRLGNTWKAKNCKEILKGKTDYLILRTSKNHFSGGEPRQKRKELGIIGYGLNEWANKWSTNLKQYNPIVELNDIEKNITKRKVSSGFGVAHYFSNKYPEHSIYLVGFAFQGFAGHNWVAERDWCSNKENIILL